MVDLPTAEGSFVGRQMELRRIERALTGRERDRRLVLITGMGGIGKSTLAARAAQRCAQAFATAYAVKCESAPPLEQILIELGAFPTANGDPAFDQALRTDAPCPSSWPPWCRPWRKGKEDPTSSSLTT